MTHEAGIKTTNTGGYFSRGDDPARVTWFDEETENKVYPDAGVT